ncbi:MAG: hypothetical protein JWN37_447 [Candidatus Nomurabacteria bacterium]|nr:hypothetical protein [Candidatus Nomurabacteria bacterium]
MFNPFNASPELSPQEPVTSEAEKEKAYKNEFSNQNLRFVNAGMVNRALEMIKYEKQVILMQAGVMEENDPKFRKSEKKLIPNTPLWDKYQFLKELEMKTIEVKNKAIH